MSANHVSTQQTSVPDEDKLNYVGVALFLIHINDLGLYGEAIGIIVHNYPVGEHAAAQSVGRFESCTRH